MKFNPFIIINLLLGLFIGIGLGLTVFMILQDVKIIGAYIVSVLFILFPGTLLYCLNSGFSVSEKTVKKQAERQEHVIFDANGIWYNLPLFDTTQFINWNIIETVIYTNYQSDDHAKFIFRLTKPPVHTMTENPWFLNKIFPFALRNKKEVTIEDDCKNFREIPKMLETYLTNTNPIDLNADDRKETLLSSKTTGKNGTVRTEEHWKPDNNYERERIVYDKYNRNSEQIRRPAGT
ncbi:hypothetical protein [Chryseobacterium gregarium]|uniref:hypothetical protein n=1 Tax=Chryseobacterium gregarium TaxID=456299 RepID=UPI0004131B1E|nr:hypothetical protein [Chryseobacterium gregarium]